MTEIFSCGEFQLEYRLYGNGEENILCFHGFGRIPEDFEVLLPLLKPGQRMVSVSLFAHGKSVFPENRIVSDPLMRNEWSVLMRAFTEHLKITSFHLVGYSMGGRVVFITMLEMKDRIKSVLLLAPDGLKINWLYRFASGTKVGHSLYIRLIKNPEPLFVVSKCFNRIGILSDKLLRFVFVHLDTIEKRKQVHDAWMIYRKFFPGYDELAEVINSGKFPFHMIFGRFDEVIKPRLGEKLQLKLKRKDHLLVAEMGHRLMNTEMINFIHSHHLWPGDLTEQVNLN